MFEKYIYDKLMCNTFYNSDKNEYLEDSIEVEFLENDIYRIWRKSGNFCSPNFPFHKAFELEKDKHNREFNEVLDVEID